MFRDRIIDRQFYLVEQTSTVISAVIILPDGYGLCKSHSPGITKRLIQLYLRLKSDAREGQWWYLQKIFHIIYIILL